MNGFTLVFFLALLAMAAIIGVIITASPSSPLVGSRTYSPDLSPEHELRIVDGLVADIQSDPTGWKFGPHTMSKGKWEIWIANTPYADMDVEKPVKIHISGAGAKRLRQAKNDAIVAQLIPPLVISPKKL